MVSIGDEFLDGYKETIGWYSHGVKWFGDLAEFYRERAAIEREAAAKLQQLVGKHFNKKAAATTALSVGDQPATTPGSLENASATMWSQVLGQTEEAARARKQLGDDLQAKIGDQLANLSSRFESLQELSNEFHTAIEHDRDTAYAAVKKAKHTYDEVAESMEHARAKGRKVDVREAELANAKDAYLLSINVANRIKDKYFHDDLPELLDAVQMLNEARTGQVNRVITQAADTELACLKACKAAALAQREIVAKNQPHLDTAMFVRHNVRPWQDPTDFYFQPSPVWHEDDAMNTNENGLKFLRARVTKADADREAATQASQQALALYEEAKAEDGKADFATLPIAQAATLLKTHLVALKAVVRSETKRLSIEAEIETIEAATAGLDLSAVPVTRTKTTRTLLGKKKEIVEELAPDGGRRTGGGSSLGLISVLARKAKAAGLPVGSGEATASVLYTFAAEGDGEISVTQGEQLPLVSADDGSGWIKVRRGGEEGVIPASYATISGGRATGSPAKGAEPPTPPPPRSRGAAGANDAAGGPVMVALYDYTAIDSTELTIKANDRINITAPDTGNGWTTGELHGKTGAFPTSYARPA